MDSGSPVVQGDVRNLSEHGACVVTEGAVRDGVVTLNVRNGHSFLFRAEARLVWREAPSAARRAADASRNCAQGLRFTELAPFTRNLIRRLSERGRMLDPLFEPAAEWTRLDSDSDPDLQILFREETPPKIPADTHEDRFDAIDDTLFESTLLDDTPQNELTGCLEYFDAGDVLQMLEATRATGVLCIDGPCAGEIHIFDGRIGRCVSGGLSDEEAAFRLIVAREGRFCFVPARVETRPRRLRNVTQVVLEAKMRWDEEGLF